MLHVADVLLHSAICPGARSGGALAPPEGSDVHGLSRRMAEPREKLADARALPEDCVGGRQTPIVNDPLQRRRRLVDRNLVDVAQRRLDGIGIRDGRPEGVMLVTKIRGVAAQGLLHDSSRAKARFGGVDDSSVDDLPFLLWRQRCWCARFHGVMFPASREMRKGPAGSFRLASWVGSGAGRQNVGRSAGTRKRKLPSGRIFHASGDHCGASSCK